MVTAAFDNPRHREPGTIATAGSTLHASTVLRWLYAAGVVAIPFDGIPGVAALGELAHEASFYFFGPALIYALTLRLGALLMGAARGAAGARWVLGCAAVLLGAVALSGIANLGGMAGASFHDRGGLPKFATAFVVIVYGIGLAWLTVGVVAQDWYRRLVVPVCVSAAVCLVVCLFEGASAWGVHIPPFDAFYTAIHAGGDGSAVLWDGSPNLKLLEGWDKRLRSVSFEPPAFGTFAGLAWPWLACGVALSRGRRRTAHVALVLAFTVLIIVAQARTGWLLLACDVAALAGLRFALAPGGSRSGGRRLLGVAGVAAAAVVAIAAFYILSYDAIVATVVQGDSVSNLTRFAYQVTGYRMFLAHPPFGVGLGQFAFHAADFMPSWGFLSAEIRPSLVFADAPWPNTYSIYARLAAETGLVGLAAWLGIWIATAARTALAALAEVGRTGRANAVYYAVIMAVAGIVASGVTDDSFRKPLIWIALGAAASLAPVAFRPGSPPRGEHRVDPRPPDHR